MNNNIPKAIEILQKAKHVTAFTGAGISVESGIPPFRGKNGIWNKYDSNMFDLNTFQSNPIETWKLIKDIYYGFMGKAKPNPAHIALAEMEAKGIIKAIITQNIDNLHQEGGSKVVYEFHGNSKHLLCLDCSKKYKYDEIDMEHNPPSCKACGGLLKPDFIFFGEGIPKFAYEKSFEQTELADVFIIVGTTGTVMPASYIPTEAKKNGAKIIEVNTEPSNFTDSITDVFLQGKAGTILAELVAGL